jgi:hypothetical protein
MDNQTKQSSFVVKAYALSSSDANTKTYAEYDNCVMTLSDNGDFKLSSMKDTNNIYIEANVLRESIFILSRNDNNDGTDNNTHIDIELTFLDKTFGIRFDERSSASEKKFMDEHNLIVSKKQSIEHYASGNIKFEGPKTESGFNGQCKLYHDNDKKIIMIDGEFEDSKPDGSCVFHSEDGIIHLACLNVSSGKPNGSGCLTIDNHDIETIQMVDYSDIDTMDPLFTTKIYSKIDPDYQNKIERIQFMNMSIDKRLLFIYDELQKMKTTCEPQKQPRGIFGLF